MKSPAASTTRKPRASGKQGEELGQLRLDLAARRPPHDVPAMVVEEFGETQVDLLHRGLEMAFQHPRQGAGDLGGVGPFAQQRVAQIEADPRDETQPQQQDDASARPQRQLHRTSPSSTAFGA